MIADITSLKTAQPLTGVLLVNLGSPEAPTPQAVRRYLRQFLSDPDVVTLPRLLWLPLLYLLILPTRPAKSAVKYSKIWTEEGSPLLVHTQRQAKLLNGYLWKLGHENIQVDWAMRYGSPNIPERIRALKKAGCQRIIVFPLYPQYTRSTTRSVERVLAKISKQKLTILPSYFQSQNYIDALAESVRTHWMRNGRAEKLLMSFHGIPQQVVDAGDPYQVQCQETANRLAATLQIGPEAWQISFQSRFGKARWLTPYTEATLISWARAGIEHVDVICPGFSSDCLETLEEINLEYRQTFLSNGGKEFQYIPCLNENDAWIRAMVNLVERHLDD